MNDGRCWSTAAVVRFGWNAVRFLLLAAICCSGTHCRARHRVDAYDPAAAIGGQRCPPPPPPKRHIRSAFMAPPPPNAAQNSAHVTFAATGSLGCRNFYGVHVSQHLFPNSPLHCSPLPVAGPSLNNTCGLICVIQFPLLNVCLGPICSPERSPCLPHPVALAIAVPLHSALFVSGVFLVRVNSMATGSEWTPTPCLASPLCLAPVSTTISTPANPQ